MKLSIIIISYNTKQLLYDCIKSIKQSVFSFPYEIIVVDNNSADGSQSMLKEHFPEVYLIENRENKLFAIANNQGAAVAKGEYLLLLNSDTIVRGDNLDRLVKYYDTLPPNVACVGPKVLNVDGSLQSQGFSGMHHWDTITRHFKLGTILPSFMGRKILPPGTYRFNHNEPHEVSWVVGACMLCRADIYHKVGGLNESLEFYGEEPEFGYRTKKQGFRTIYYPFASIVHLGGQSTKKTSNEDAEKENSLRRYAIIVNETVGYEYAIMTSKITKLAYQIKLLLSCKPISCIGGGVTN